MHSSKIRSQACLCDIVLSSNRISRPKPSVHPGATPHEMPTLKALGFMSIISRPRVVAHLAPSVWHEQQGPRRRANGSAPRRSHARHNENGVPQCSVRVRATHAGETEAEESARHGPAPHFRGREARVAHGPSSAASSASNLSRNLLLPVVAARSCCTSGCASSYRRPRIR